MVKDKLWYFVSAEYWRQVTTPVGAADTSDREIPRFLGKLTYQADESNRLMVMVEYDEVINERRGIGEYACPRRSPSRRRPGRRFALDWESLRQRQQLRQRQADRLRRPRRLPPLQRRDHARAHRLLTPRSLEEPGDPELNHRQRRDPRRVVEPVRGRPASARTTPTRSSSARSTRRRRSSTLGGATAASRTTTTPRTATRSEAYFADPTCGVASRLHRDRLRRVQRPSEVLRPGALRPGLGAPRPVTVNVGVRYGAYEGGWQYGHGDSTVYDVDFVDPRLGLVWDVFGDAAHRGQGALGPLPREDVHLPVRPRDVRPRGRPRPGLLLERGRPAPTTTATSRPSSSSPRMGDVNHPYVDEMLLTFEQQLGKDMSYRRRPHRPRFRDIMAMINVNDDYELLTRPEQPLRRRQPAGLESARRPRVRAHHRQRRATATTSPRSLRFDKRYADGWQLRSFAGVDRHRRQHPEEQRLRRRVPGPERASPTPTAGWTAYNEWEFKLSGAVDLPLGFQVSAASTPTSPAGTGRRTSRIRGLDYNAYGPATTSTSRSAARSSCPTAACRPAAGLEHQARQDTSLTASLEAFNLLNRTPSSTSAAAGATIVSRRRGRGRGPRSSTAPRPDRDAARDPRSARSRSDSKPLRDGAAAGPPRVFSGAPRRCRAPAREGGRCAGCVLRCGSRSSVAVGAAARRRAEGATSS